GADGLHPVDVRLVDAEFARNDLTDLDVEANRLAVEALETEERLVELRADSDRAGLVELGHGRAGLELDLYRCLGTRGGLGAGTCRQGEGARECECRDHQTLFVESHVSSLCCVS